MKTKKILLCFFLPVIINAESLSTIPEISKLKNFSKLKNIETEKILDSDTQIIFNNNLAYEKESKNLFTGTAIQKVNNEIRNINFYENGKITYFYKYFLDGNIEESNEFDKAKNQHITEKYDKNNKLTYQRIYENGFLKSENQYVKGKLSTEYKAIDDKNGKFIYYANNKKPYLESEIEQTVQNGNVYQITKNIKIYGKNGKPEREYNFKNGSIKNQPQKVYYSNGNLKYLAIAKNEDVVRMEIKELYEEYNPNGEKKMSCKEIEDKKWECEYYKKNGEIKSRKQITRDFSKNLSTFQYIYDSEPGMDFLKAVGEGIGTVFLTLLEGLLSAH